MQKGKYANMNTPAPVDTTKVPVVIERSVCNSFLCGAAWGLGLSLAIVGVGKLVAMTTTAPEVASIPA